MSDDSKLIKIVSRGTLESWLKFSSNGMNLLTQLLTRGDYTRSEFILKHGFPVDENDRGGPCTALTVMVTDNNAAAVKFLLAHGADPNGSDSQDGTPLHHAALWGHPEMVNLLLAAGADVNRESPWGTTPLYVAIDLAKSQEVIDLLVAAGGKG
jgi:ankyrin repeat protein